jgi:hypothetical protein
VHGADEPRPRDRDPQHLTADGNADFGLPLATRDLRIIRSRLGDRAGVVGAVIEEILSPETVDAALRAGA